MNRPLPMIYAPTGAARRRVVDAIYAANWRLGVLTRTQVDSGPRGTPEDAIECPYIILHDGLFGVIKDTSWWSSHTLVNSPSHLIAYCKTLGPRAPKTHE